MRLVITDNGVGRWAANYVSKRIRNFNPGAGRNFVLGLPTGGTPLEMYQHLIKMHKAGRVSFKNVTTFNMDEYIGLPRNHKESYYTYMHENLFNHVDIAPGNVNILDGNAQDIAEECQSYERRIADSGGVELFLGGVGENGHIAFNEPYSSLASLTRDKKLNSNTRAANSRFFDNDINQVPHSAMTVGIQTIMNAREVLIMITGAKKALALKECIEGAISQSWPITALQLHRRVLIVADEEACIELKVKTYRYFKELRDEYSAIEDM